MKMMKRLSNHLLIGVTLAVTTCGALAFSLLGPFKPWQTVPIGYNLPGDIGGPMTPTEGFRWNVPTIVYAFDQSFFGYFGLEGVEAVEDAIAILNDLPPVGEITDDGTSLYVRGQQVPTDTKRVNFQAQALGLLDLKSHALSLLVEEMGLAEAERYVWTLRGRNTETIANQTYTNYTIVKLNFDPITFQPSSFVNDVLYNYTIADPIAPQNYADAIEFPSDPLAFAYSSVAGGFVTLSFGEYFTGLTRDDVGGLRFLYNRNNFAVDNTIAGVGQGRANLINSSPWVPFTTVSNILGGTNINIPTIPGITNAPGGTNATNFVVTALRRGIEKLNFERGNYDSLIGQLFVSSTNFFTDRFVSNGIPVTQPLQRAVTAPDILFTSEDIGLAGNLTPVLSFRTGTGGWQDNNAVNGVTDPNSVGPGVITPTVVIAFSNQLPYFGETTPFLGTVVTQVGSGVWARFDGTTNAPVIFPRFLSLTLDDLRNLNSGN